MSRPVAVLRPAPGDAATAARVEALGLRAIRLPLFEVRPLAWAAPDPAAFDALLLTSANAVRHAGPGLARLAGLPVYTVGEATARAAVMAGLRVVATGGSDAAALLDLAAAHGVARALHLGGRERGVVESGAVARSLAVYASEAVAFPSLAPVRSLENSVVLLHSPRAAARWGALVDAAGAARSTMRLAALSRAVADAAGSGWERVDLARRPTEDALMELLPDLARWTPRPHD